MEMWMEVRKCHQIRNIWVSFDSELSKSLEVENMCIYAFRKLMDLTAIQKYLDKDAKHTCLCELLAWLQSTYK